MVTLWLNIGFIPLRLLGLAPSRDKINAAINEAPTVEANWWQASANPRALGLVLDAGGRPRTINEAHPGVGMKSCCLLPSGN
jgi:hypothetical protein